MAHIDDSVSVAVDDVIALVTHVSGAVIWLNGLSVDVSMSQLSIV